MHTGTGRIHIHLCGCVLRFFSIRLRQIRGFFHTAGRKDQQRQNRGDNRLHALFTHGISPGCLIHNPVNAAMATTGLNPGRVFSYPGRPESTDKAHTGDADQLTLLPGRL
jgi:hypothetical protein